MKGHDSVLLCASCSENLDTVRHLISERCCREDLYVVQRLLKRLVSSQLLLLGGGVNCTRCTCCLLQRFVKLSFSSMAKQTLSIRRTLHHRYLLFNAHLQVVNYHRLIGTIPLSNRKQLQALLTVKSRCLRVFVRERHNKPILLLHNMIQEKTAEAQ